MHLTQILAIELTTACNLGKEHPACPNMDPERYKLVDTTRALTDEKIVEVVRDAYEKHRFTGAVAWHYYNEPLCAKERMLALMERIKALVPAARFLLWTNGELIPAQCDFLNAFDFCWITDYKGNQDFKHVKRRIRRTRVVRWQLDERIDPTGPKSLKPCGRPFSEFIIDHFGNVHICCIDWRGVVQVGNVWDDSLESILPRWAAIRDACVFDMAKAPDFCQCCKLRHPVAPLIPDVAQKARAYTKAATRAHLSGRHKKSLPEAQNGPILALACLPGAGSPDAWENAHRGEGIALYHASGPTDAERQLKRSGAHFGGILTSGQMLQGAVADALKIHMNENLLRINAESESGAPAPAFTIAKIRDVSHWVGCRPSLRPRAHPKQITLEELLLITSDKPRARRVAVTFTHYRIPEARLIDHFRWNEEVYRTHNASVFVVTDKQYAVPDYAQCLVYPEEMPKFALAKTSNFGIRHAIESGFDLIIKTDADIAFSNNSFAGLVETFEGCAGLPVYNMASSYAAREKDYIQAPNATGTISMVADDWRKAHFHEGCVGYGCDDGILRREMKRRGIRECRDWTVDHIAHIEGTPQQEFNKQSPRIDHWNRESGFNPENFSGNRGLHGRIFKGEDWGLPGCAKMAVVITHYRMPKRRLDEFIDWNGKLFEANGIRLLVVSDVQRKGLPHWCRVAVYPSELPVFNLSKTSNYGIRLIGGGIICKADPDNAFSQEVIDAMLLTTPESGVCPRFFMAESFAAMEQCKATWDASKGCLCLHWQHWQKICGYDERCEGYGIEDGDCFQRARVIPGHSVSRLKIPFWHIAHTNQRQGRGNSRPDCWGRADGFNPRNHRQNCNAMREGPWKSEDWGNALLQDM